MAAAIAAGGAGQVPAIVNVAPSGATVPARLLRLSVTFATPQAGATVLPAALLRADGAVIPHALIDQQLWSPDRRTLTLLIDPGRVKSGLLARAEAGPVMQAGDAIALRIGDAVVHRWRVIAGGCVTPDPAAWTLAAPRPGSREALTIGFPGPIDALSRDLIAVADSRDNRIDGAAMLSDDERRWRFVPLAPWPRGRLQIFVHPRLEDPCGGEPGEPFEHAAGRGAGPNRAAYRRTFITQ
jgi:hypothetical protein